MIVLCSYLQLLLKKHKSKVVALIFLIMMMQCLAVIVIVMTGKIIDALGDKQIESAIFLVSLYCAAVVLRVAIGPFQQRFRDRLFNSTVSSLGLRWCRSLLDKDFSFFKNLEVGALVRAYDRGLSAVYRMYVFFAEKVFYELIKAIFVSVYIIYLGGGEAFLIVFSGFLIFVFIVTRVLEKLKPIMDRINYCHDRISEQQAQLFGAFRSIQSVGAINTAPQALKKSYHNYSRYNMKYALYSSIIRGARFLLPGVCAGAVVLYYILTAEDTVNGWSSGDFVVIFLLVLELMTSLSLLLEVFPVKDEFIESQRNIQKALSCPVHGEQGHKQCSFDEASCQITVMPFSYSLSSEKKVNLVCKEKIVIKPGSHVAIMGASGEGKTTLSEIIVGIKKSKGCVFFNDIDVSDLSEESRIDLIYLEEHQSKFLQGDFFESVMFGKTNSFDISQKSIIQKLGLSHVKGLLHGGSFNKDHLSAGDRKRLGVVRACLFNRPITILDEPTESLRADLKQGMWCSVLELFRNRTVICITHDEEFAREFDYVISIKDHQIALSR